MKPVTISVRLSDRGHWVAVLSSHPSFDLNSAVHVRGEDEADAAGKCLTWMMQNGVTFDSVQVAIH